MKQMTKYIQVTLVALLVGCMSAMAQAFILSQPWSATTMVAPSFAGYTGGGRVFATYRNQWSNLKGAQTGVVGYDQYFHPIRSSFGGTVSYNSQGGGMLSQLQFNVQYTYLVQITKDWFFRPGLQVGLFYRAIDPSRMVFGDQIAADGSILPTTVFQATNTSLVRFDAAVSVMFTHPYFFGGICADRLLGNNISFTDQPETKQNVKLNVFAAGLIPISKGTGKYDPKDDVTFAALYQWQGQYHQLDIDAMYHRRFFMVGVGYRGLPFYSPNGDMQYWNDAVKICIGGSYAGFSLSYSYDVSVSSLVNISGGSHEIVLTYRFMERLPNDRSFFCY
ncbi:MAG: PorP/SprF family type IX secretion system membrane protein [Paludibacteraceae bacterium]|nr:PorP/SprF family type IX secretion system membrane protein [Paludibacteraceae bacterium]